MMFKREDHQSRTPVGSEEKDLTQLFEGKCLNHLPNFWDIATLHLSRNFQKVTSNLVLNQWNTVSRKSNTASTFSESLSGM
jgi:hypothetical protein